MSLEFVKSQRGANNLVHRRFVFQIDVKTGDKIYWKCTRSRNIKCKGRLTTCDGKITSESKEHNHTPDCARTKAKEFMTKIKNRAKISFESPSQIISTLNVRFARFCYSIQSIFKNRL